MMKKLMRKVVRAAHERLAGEFVGNSLGLSLLLTETYRQPRLVDVPEGRRILVLAPHMDDEILGCGGTLRKHVRAGAGVTAVFMTDGRRGDPELNAARLPEAERRARYECRCMRQPFRGAAPLLRPKRLRRRLHR